MNMKKIFIAFVMSLFIGSMVCSCTCTNQNVVEDEVVIEVVDSTSVDVLEAADSLAIE